MSLYYIVKGIKMSENKKLLLFISYCHRDNEEHIENIVGFLRQLKE